MLGILFIIVVAAYLTFLYPILKRATEPEKPDPKEALQVKKLWAIAQTSMKSRQALHFAIRQSASSKKSSPKLWRTLSR